MPHLSLTLPPNQLAGFASLLQHGIFFPVEGPISAWPFLLAVPGFTADYLEQAVQTVFINGVAVDNLKDDLTAGSTIALSAAMPGLAGAIFRRQGAHGSLRSQPSRPSTNPNLITAREGITLKLFNSIATDRVGDLMTAGVRVRRTALHDFAHRRSELFQAPGSLTLDGQPTSLALALEKTASSPMVEVQVKLTDCSSAEH